MSEPIHQEVTFAATPQRLFEALMNEDQHGAFTGGAAHISKDVGGAFACHDGQIVGRNIELEPNRRIVQAWRVANWDDGVYSVVKLDLQPDGEQTRLVLDHSGVPEASRDQVAAGWPMRYWEPLKAYLG